MSKLRLLITIHFLITALATFCLKPIAEYSVLPEQYGLVYKEVAVITEDGYRIKCFLFPAQEAKKVTAEMYNNPHKYPYASYPPRKTVIVSSGDGGNMMNMLSYIHTFATNGFNVVSFDWRGFGESDSWETDENLLCYAEYIIDYEAVVNEINKQAEVDGIGVFGVSTGAYLSMAVAAKNKNVTSFAGRALMTNFEEVLLNLHKIRPERELTYPDNYPNNLLPINLSHNFTKPTLLIVGEDDDRTPVSMSQRIFDNIKGKKELWIVPDAGHGSEIAPEAIQSEKFWQKVITFFQENI